MLKINLLSMRFDAERQYRKLRAGDACDYLTMLEDRTVRRRVHQNIRNDQKKPVLTVQRAERQVRKIETQLSRRRGMSLVPLLSRVQGSPNRDVGIGRSKQVGKDSVPSGVVTMKNTTEREKTSVDFRQVPEPTPTITGWERGEVEHKGRAGLRRIKRNNDQKAILIR
jgi:hypothetical protein